MPRTATTKPTRKRCLNCAHGDVVRWDGDRRFPLGVFCKLRPIPDDADPREYCLSCDTGCPEWDPRPKRAPKKASA